MSIFRITIKNETFYVFIISKLYENSLENKKSLESNPFLQRMAHILPTQYGLKRLEFWIYTFFMYDELPITL